MLEPGHDEPGSPGKRAVQAMKVVRQSTDGPARRMGWRVWLMAGGALLALVVVAAGALAIVRRPADPSVGVGGPGGGQSANLTNAAPGGQPAVQNSGPAPAVIRFGAGGDTHAIQQCDSKHPLDPLTVNLDNSASTISVDWFVDIKDKTPDGKLLWASGDLPYGTLPAGKTTTMKLTPDPNLCKQLQGKKAPVTYHATVSYAGVGGVDITDTITPASGPPVATPVATVAPGP